MAYRILVNPTYRKLFSIIKMLEPWNDKSVSPPPVNTSLCKSNIDLKMLKYTLNNITNILSKQSPLHSESAILSRLLYKFDKKFRNDIGYRTFRKVNCALRRYLTLNLLKDVEQFKSVLPEEEETPYYMPTRQMLEYILIRIIAFSKIMLRVVICSKQAAIFYLDRLKRGESHWMSLMPYSVLSRIWSMTLVLVQHSCSWYQLLYPFLCELEIKGVNFLPTDYSLPVNLGDWLNIKEINNFGRLEWSKKHTINTDSLLINDDVQDFEKILDYVNQINEDREEMQESNRETLKSNIMGSFNIAPVGQVDQGETISRDSFKKLMENKQLAAPSAVKKDDYFHIIENVTDKNTLQTFINNEEMFRNEGNNRSLTNHLSFMQWQALKNAMLKLDSLTLKNRKLQRRFQKIWQDKCTDA